MSKLSTAQRNKLPDSAFALPGRRYPIPDAAHARNALARAKEMLDRGQLSHAEYEIVVRKAKEVLGE